MFCFGYGTDHNSDLLRELTDTTGTGLYYFVKDDSNVGSAFGSAMGGILSVVAQSAVLKLAPGNAEGVEIKVVHHASAIQRDDGTFTVTVGDFYAEERRDILVEVTLAGLDPDSDSVPHLVASLAYTNILTKTPVRGKPIGCNISRPFSDVVSPDNAHVTAQWLRVLATLKMKEASNLANANKLTEANHCLQFASNQILAAAPEVRSNEMIRILMKDLEMAKSGLATSHDFQTSGRNVLSYKCQMYETQRCSETSHPFDSTSAFPSRARHALATKFDLSEK